MHPTPPSEAPPWTTWPVGARVVVRRRLAEGGFTDVLGELLEVDAHHVRVRTRRGDETVAAADIALGKIVPPAPPRRRRRADGDRADADHANGGPTPG